MSLLFSSIVCMGGEFIILLIWLSFATSGKAKSMWDNAFRKKAKNLEEFLPRKKGKIRYLENLKSQ